MKIGMIFPGQGAQFLGMGKGFYDDERIVQEYFEEANSCLEHNFVRLCFASSEKDLTQTGNAQTSIFLISSAIHALLKKKFGIEPHIVAGHSLGEYSAIFAAGGLTFPDGLYLLKKRAKFMDEVTKAQNGGMLAVIGLSKEKVQAICDQYDDPSDDKKVAQIVNYNSTSQLVVSGTMPELECIKSNVETYGGKAIMLKVAGAFHSRLMQQAEKLFSQYLFKVDLSDLNVPLVNNVDAKIIKTADEVKESLIKQTSAPVLWWQAMQHFKDCDLIIEVGPGSTFSRMLKREWPDMQVLSINDKHDIEKLIEATK